jgi:2-polyprenyl-3-methyl-5-hydroxy-6-metoxy-1,4-benzoquinol methylase
MTEKRNIEVFNKDVATGTGYQYTVSERRSVRIANDRMTRGIREAVDLSGKRVLDLGCGDGVFTLALLEMGAASIVGTDPAEVAVQAAGARAAAAGVADRVTFSVQNIYDAVPEGAAFDTVVLRGVLHHLPDAKEAVRIAARLANEIVILEPNGGNPILKIIEKTSSYHIEHEEQSFLPSTINGWLEAAGMRVVHGKLINLVPLFCPTPFVGMLKAMEPLVEAVPGLRLLGCGQYVVRAIAAGR